MSIAILNTYYFDNTQILCLIGFSFCRDLKAAVDCILDGKEIDFPQKPWYVPDDEVYIISY